MLYSIVLLCVMQKIGFLLCHDRFFLTLGRHDINKIEINKNMPMGSLFKAVADP